MNSNNVSDQVAQDLGALEDFDAATLRLRWRALSGRRLPEHLPKQMLRRMLAYRIQAEAFGDLDAGTPRILDRIARQSEENGNATPTLESLGLSTRDDRTLSPGTVLVREHNGHKHHVMLLEEGFAWQGTTYGSLSKVARAITGTNWNGYRFFAVACSRQKST